MTWDPVMVDGCLPLKTKLLCVQQREREEYSILYENKRERERIQLEIYDGRLSVVSKSLIIKHKKDGNSRLV